MASDKPIHSQSRAQAVFHKVGQNLYRLESSGGYYALLKSGGKQIRKSLQTNDRRLAERDLAKLKARLHGIKLNAGKMTFGELAKHFNETVLASKDLKPRAREYREECITALMRVWNGLKGLPIREIKRADCERWLSKRSQQIGWQLLNNEIGSLKMILEFGVREHYLLENPAAGLKRFKSVKATLRIPTREQFTTLVTQLRTMRNFDAADLVQLLGFSGMRQAEAVALKWNEINFEANYFMVTGGDVGTKNRQNRQVPLFPALRNILLQTREKLRNQRTKEEKVSRITGCLDGIASACKAASLPRFNHHAMRHFFVSNALENGVDFGTIAHWIGHSDGGILVARVYGHLRQQHSEAMAAKMTFLANPIT